MSNRAFRRFVEYFGALGSRWGLPVDACRIHAFLYLSARPRTEADIREFLSLEMSRSKEALSFLLDYRMVEPVKPSAWRTGGDPWDMLLHGLEERRRREIPEALSELRKCHRDALEAGEDARTAAAQVEKMLDLVEDFAALEAQTQRLSPRFIRGLLKVSGRAARFIDQATGRARGGNR